jgi:Na+/melibiose symporter-like transporter
MIGFSQDASRKEACSFRIRRTAHFVCEFLSLVCPNFMTWVLGCRSRAAQFFFNLKVFMCLFVLRFTCLTWPHTRERNSQTKCAVLLILKEHASLRDEKDESWDINKTVRYLLENFNPKNGKTHVSLFFSNLTVCCICIYRINFAAYCCRNTVYGS